MTPSPADRPLPSTGLRPPRARRSSRRTLAAVVVLAAVCTAGAPSVVTIRPGDTLWDLAKAHGTSVSELRRLNDLPGNGAIYAGRTLKVPGSGGSPSSSGRSETVHRVVAGDTLSEIAKRYGVSSAAISQRNGLGPRGVVRLGARLVIPGSRAAGAAASSTTVNAGVRIPGSVQSSAAAHRAELARRSLPSKAQAKDMVRATAKRLGVDTSLALAVAFHESGFQQRVVSPVDAIGVMQVLPSTGRGISKQIGRDLDLLDTQDNVTAGVYLLRQLVRTTGSTDKALAGYYQGLGSVAKRGRLPQTEQYIRSIEALRPRFR